MNHYEDRLFLHPGEMFAGDQPIVITTVLGSCISVVLWDTSRRIGGINHFLLPNGPSDEDSGRYGDSAVVLLLRKMRDFGISRVDVARLDISKCLEIFRLNDERIVRELVDQAQAAKLSLSEIRQTVQRALGIRPISADEEVKKMWAFALDQWLVIERAIQHVQRGGPVSDTRALELICADFLAGVQHEAIAAEVA